MNKVFIGMIFVFLDFDLNIGNSKIGLIPDFIGYIYMYKGATELIIYSEKFENVCPIIAVMATYSVLTYVAGLMGLSVSLGIPVMYILSLIATIISLIISNRIVKGVGDIEIATSSDLNYIKLYSTWKHLAAFSIATSVQFIIPTMFIFIACAIISFIIGIYYLFVFNTSKKLYYENVE